MKLSIRSVLLSFLIVGTSCSFAQPLVETVDLFDGNDLAAWKVQNDGQFSVEDGVLKIDRGTGWLRSNDVFGDFVLHIEFRFMEKGANSGIFVRTGATSHNDEKGYPDNGYQIQCMDTLEGANPIGNLIPYGAPPFEVSHDLAAATRAYRPALEWQSFDIVCLGESMKVWLNGEPVMTATNIKNADGHVGIQGELGLLEFRAIDLKRL